MKGGNHDRSNKYSSYISKYCFNTCSNVWAQEQVLLEVELRYQQFLLYQLNIKLVELLVFICLKWIWEFFLNSEAKQQVAKIIKIS